VQTANAGRLTDATNATLVERRLHPFFIQQLPLSIGQETRSLLPMSRVIIVHCLLQRGRGIHSILQSRNPSGGFKPINPQAQLRPYQPVKRGKRLVIDYRGHTNDQRLTAFIRHRDRAQSPGLSTQQHGDAGALIVSERRFLMVRLHGQMVTPESIDPGIEWE
jgi:hypothetical protein